MIKSLWIFPILLFTFCKNTTSNPEGIHPSANQQSSVRQVFIASVDHLRIREQPDMDAPVLHTLREGDVVLWHGEATSRKETINLRGKNVTASWYKVSAGELISGWVFAGALDPWVPERGTAYNECLQHYNKGRLNQFYPCLEKASHALSGTSAAIVTPDMLRIMLQNSESRIFKHNRQPGDDYRYYQYLGNIAYAPVAVVKVNKQGGSDFILVHLKTGQTLTVAGIPQPLPVGNVLLCAGADLPSNSFVVQVISAGSKTMEVLLEQPFSEQSMTQLTWKVSGMPALDLQDAAGNHSVWTLQLNADKQWDVLQEN